MKPLPGDHRHKMRISGEELRELKKHTDGMVEAFGLDRKIENYQGTRPITLYRWDLECLMDVIDFALKDEKDYPNKSTPDYQALQRLGQRFQQEYDTVYGEKSSGLGKVMTPAKGVSKPVSIMAPSQKTDVLKVSSKSSKSDAVYQFKITLADTKPPVWRRIEVADCTLLEFNEIIQIVMGWDGTHMWAFDIGNEHYGEDDSGEMEMASSSEITLRQIVQTGVKKFRCTYDFGDN